MTGRAGQLIAVRVAPVIRGRAVSATAVLAVLSTAAPAVLDTAGLAGPTIAAPGGRPTMVLEGVATQAPAALATPDQAGWAIDARPCAADGTGPCSNWSKVPNRYARDRASTPEPSPTTTPCHRMARLRQTLGALLSRLRFSRRRGTLSLHRP